MANLEKLYVPQKQHDSGYSELLHGLARAGVESPRRVADTISAHLLKNTRTQILTIERWADRNSTITIPSTGYDAMVVSGATTDSATRTYPTVFEAIRALDALGFVTARIGLTARGGTITETAALGALSGVLTSVDLHGIDGLLSGTDFAPATRWSHGGFSTTGSGLQAWRLFEVSVNTGGTKTEFFQASSPQNVAATRCKFIGTIGGLTPTITTATGVAWLIACEAIGCSPASVQAFDCYWNFNSVPTVSTPGFQFVGGVWENSSADSTVTCTGTNPVVLMGVRFTGSTRTITISSTTARRVYITGECERVSNSKLALSISGHTNIHIDVEEGFSATIGASAASTVIGNFFGGTWVATTDLTGPILVDAVLNRTTFRGKGVSGSAQIFVESSPSGTALTTVGLLDSALVISARLAPGVGAGTQKSYAIDATSARCVIVFAGKNEFATVGTNAGTKVYIIDEDGVPSSSIGPTQLANTAVTPGTYGDATNVGQFTVDQQGRVTGAANVAITSGAVAKLAGDFGDGVTTLFTITHGFTTLDIIVSVQLTATGEIIYPTVKAISTTQMTIDMGATVLAAAGGRWTVMA